MMYFIFDNQTLTGVFCKKRFLVIYTLLFLLLSTFSFAQNKLIRQIQSDYPKESLVVLENELFVSIDIDHDSLKISTRKRLDKIHLTKLSSNFNEEKIFSSFFNALQSFEAFTMKQQKRGWKKIPATQVESYNEDSRGIFFDDVETKKISFPAISSNSRSILIANHIVKEPRLLPSFYFQSIFKTKNAKLIIKAHKDVSVSFKEFHFKEFAISYSKETSDDYTTHTWEGKELPEFTIEPESTSIASYSPHVIFFIKGFSIEGNYIPVLSELKDLHQWYFDLISSNKPNNPYSSIDSLVSVITENSSNPIAKARSVYYWVRDNINYVAFEQGLLGFVPASPEYVFDTRYGDCKGMATLLKYMLSQAGLQSYLTWIGTREIPYSYTEIPTPQVDNHMIVSYRDDDGKLYFLDPTSKYGTFELPSSMIQGKQALISISKDSFLTEHVPLVKSMDNEVIDSVEFFLEEDMLIRGRGVISFSGYSRVGLLPLIYGKPKSIQKERLIPFLIKGNNTFSIDSLSIEDLEDPEKPLKVYYTFSVKDYCRKVGDEIFINLNLDELAELIKIPPERKFSIENEFLISKKLIQVFCFPKGYEVTFNPKDLVIFNEVFNLSVNYNKSSDKLILEQKFSLNKLMLHPRHFNVWNKAISEYKNYVNESAVFAKK